MTVQQSTIDQFGLLTTFDGTEIFYVIKSNGAQFQDFRITGSLLVSSVIDSLPSSLVTLADDQTISGLKRFERTVEIGVVGQGLVLDAPTNQKINLDFAQAGAIDYSFCLTANEEFQFLDSLSNVIFQHSPAGLRFPNGLTAGGTVIVPEPSEPEQAARLSNVDAIATAVAAVLAALNEHEALTNNPHSVTAEQVGSLSSSAINALVNTVQQALNDHEALTNNPHSVTAEQVGNATAQWNANQFLGVALLASTPQDAEVWAYNSVTQRYELGPKSATPIGQTLESIKNLTTVGLIKRLANGLASTITVSSFMEQLLGKTETEAKQILSAGTVSVRHAIQQAPESNSLPDWLEVNPTGIGASVRTKSLDNVPLILAFTQEPNVDGSPQDLLVKISANVSPTEWDNLPNGTNYLYVEENSGSLSYGATQITPLFSTTYPSSPINNQSYYNTRHIGQSELFDGTNWIKNNRLFIGQVEVSSSIVTDFFPYATQGKTVLYDLTLQLGTVYNFNHFLGIFPYRTTGFLTEFYDDVSGTNKTDVNLEFDSSYIGAYYGCSVVGYNPKNLTVITSDSGLYHSAFTGSDYILVTTASKAKVIAKRLF